MEIILTQPKTYDAKFVRAKCGVRYWEDATVNGIEDEDGKLIPFKEGECWKPIIDIDNGKIANWPLGTVANIHYKVCDDGAYELLDENFELIKNLDGYVPNIMCHGDNGYGDYVIMNIDECGFIEDFEADLSDFIE